MDEQRSHRRTGAERSVKSAARVLDLLELLAGVPGGIGVNEVSRRLGIPKSSTSALVATLAARGYVVNGSEGIALADVYRDQGWQGGETARLLRQAGPVMRRLAARTGESSFLGVPTPSFEVRYVHKTVSDSDLRYDADLALLRPAYCTTIGLVLLAGLAPDQLDRYFKRHDLVKLTPKTVTSEARIREAVAQARRNGHARLSDTHVLGTAGVAAPVRCAGRVVAGLAVIAPAERFDTQAALNVDATVAAARELSQALEPHSAGRAGAVA